MPKKNGWNPLKTLTTWGCGWWNPFFTSSRSTRTRSTCEDFNMQPLQPPKKGAKTRGFHRIRLEHLGISACLYVQRLPFRGRRAFGWSSIVLVDFGGNLFEVKKGKFPILPSLQLAVRPWKVGFWKTSFLFGRPTFRSYLSCRECTCPRLTCLVKKDHFKRKG